MTTPFSRSIRILDADKFRPSLLIIGIAVTILIVWLLWLVFAQVTLLETGHIVRISPVGEVRTQFTGENAQRIKVGQLGLLELGGDAGEGLGLVSVIVVNRNPPVNQNTSVDLLILDEKFYTIPFDEAFTGRVYVEVDRLSPLTLFLRSSGQFASAPRVSTTPQQPPDSN